MARSQCAKINYSEITEREKFFLGVLLKTYMYEDRTLCSSFMLWPNESKLLMTVNTIWWKQIIFNLMKRNIIVEDGDDSRNIQTVEFNIYFDSIGSNEHLYEELLHPMLTEQNKEVMIPLVMDDLNKHVIQMLKAAFLYSQTIDSNPDYPFDSRITEEISGWQKRTKEFMVRVTEIMGDLIQIEKTIDSESLVEQIKDVLKSKYDEIFKINKEFNSLIHNSMQIEYNSYTALVCEMIGKNYEDRDTSNFTEYLMKYGN